MPPRHLLLAVLIAVAWGTNMVALKWSLLEIPPFLLTALRFLLTALPAIFFIRRPAVSWRFMALYASFMGILQYGFCFTALEMGAPAGLSSVLIQTQVFFTFGLAVWLLGERPSRIQIAGTGIAFGGVAVMMIDRLEAAALLPLLLMLASAFFCGVSNIIAKKAGRIDMLGLVVWSSLIVPVPMLVLSVLFEGGFGVFAESAAQLTWRGGLSVLHTAFFSTLFAWGAWAVLLGIYPANTVAPFTLLVPFFGIGSGILVLGETISHFEIAGCVLVLAGLAVNVGGPRLLARRAP